MTHWVGHGTLYLITVIYHTLDRAWNSVFNRHDLPQLDMAWNSVFNQSDLPHTG